MFKQFLIACFIFIISITGFLTSSEAKSLAFSERQEVQSFIQDMCSKHHFDKQELMTLFKKFSTDSKVLQAISKPYEEVNWSKYKNTFVNNDRANAGVQFWKNNAAMLAKAEAEFGVPAEIIVAIIGVETYYGRNTGHFPVLQSLATLAFDYPRRAEFFKSELEQFLLLVKEEKLDPISTLGSFAGAMGTPQFMPSSYRRYAINYSGSGNRDLIHNVSDAIGSVANYFKQHGWETGERVAHEVKARGQDYQKIAISSKNPIPKINLSDFSQYNIHFKDENALKKDYQKQGAFIILNKDNPSEELWVGLKNFHVITRYNHSVHYAMAVYLLSQRIKQLKDLG